VKNSALALAVALAIVAPTMSGSRLSAQNSPTIIGGMVGYNSTTGVWQPAAESQAVGGFTAGAFLHASTPVQWFSVLAEGAWVQRGSDVTGTVEGQPLTGGVRSDYLTVTIQPRGTITLGPVRFHASAGPTLDLLVRSRIDPALAPVLYQDVGTVFGATGAVGLGVAVGPRYRVELEARMFEGLGDAYTGDFIAMRNRSLEVVARVGIPRAPN